MKKYLILFVSLFLLFTGYGQYPIKAEDTYYCSFEFAELNGEVLPDEVNKLLPEKEENLSDGYEVELNIFEDVETKDCIYHFLGWNPEKAIIEKSNLHITGTWLKENKEDVKNTQIKVIYEFIEGFAADGYGYLPDEIMELLPEETSISLKQSPVFPELTEKVGTYRFDGWNAPVLEVTTSEMIIQGVWVNENPDNSAPLLKMARSNGTISGLGSSWTYVRRDGYGDYSRYQYTINGQPAWCVEPDVLGWPLAGTGYEYVGVREDKVARIIGMGLKNGMSAGAIQAAIDRYRGHDAISSDGADSDPESINYSGNGSYACRIDVYIPSGYEGYIQSLGTNPECWPLKSHVSLKKKNSSTFNYIANCSGIYSLEGAEYGMFTEQECLNQIATLITNGNGDSNSVEVQPGTYYIKELQPSKGFKLDLKTYTAVVQKGENAVITSLEDPYDDPTMILLRKKSSNIKGYTEYLDTAEFTLKYYDTYDTDNLKKEKLEWIFKPIIHDGEAIVRFDREHFLSGNEELFDDNGTLKIPMGTFTIEETKAPQTYLRDPNVYIGKIYLEEDDVRVEINGGSNLLVENEQLTQNEKTLIIKTTANFKETGNDHMEAEGIGHIIDTVTYENLKKDKEYILKGVLVDKSKPDQPFTESSVEFVADEGIGTACVELQIQLDEYAEHDFVVYEYLYSKEKPDELITYHEDINDEGQTVHVDKIYEAEFVLYKVSAQSKDMRLSGAYFEVTSSRVKADGTVDERNLGRFVTGGIYYENDSEFTMKVYKDEKLEELVSEYVSSFDKKFNKQTVAALDLADGTYYVKTDINPSDTAMWTIEKGAINLGKQLKDTKLIFKELIAPKGYVLDEREYICNIGHDRSITRLENFRENAGIFNPPVTGD